ncbi:MAG: NUMOD3 domain-containing DNA-binding protein [Oscillospiraceae bacterium]|jgi:group I intron endonuclease
MSIVYKHTFPNGKIYIGITSLDPKHRYQNGRGYNHNSYMKAAIEKYWWENVKHEILASGLTPVQAEEKEKEFIYLYKSNNRDFGYNLTNGGEKNKKHSLESRMKMSVSLKGRPSPRKGVRLSEETKKKVSEAHKGLRYNIGIKFTEERKAALRKPHPSISGKNNPAYGRKWTKEELAIRQAHRVYARGGDCVNARAILQFSLTNDFIKEWSSIAEASRAVCNRTSIKDCLSGKYKRGGGYIWKYKEI